MKRLTTLRTFILQGIKLGLFVTISAVLVTVCLGRDNRRVPSTKTIQLPAPKLTGPISLEQALTKRRSVRQFTNQPLNFSQISQLAWAGQGITEPEKGFRTAPSAGAIYPIKLYFVTQEGMFVYHPAGHSLEEITSLDIRNRLAAAALKQQVVANAPCNIIITGSAKKLAPKYGSKARRYTLLEAGHIAQNILLETVSLDLAAVSVGAFDIRNVSKICKLPSKLEPLYIICIGYPLNKTQTNKEEIENNTKTKKAILIIPSENFRDEELLKTRDELTKARIETAIASTKTGLLRGMLGGKAEATILVDQLNVDDYDAVIFIGGSGARQYFDNQAALNIARQAKDKGKILAAICVAPTILANAGVLNGIRATSFSSERVKLKKAGAIFTGADIERDGPIITGRGPKNAAKFGKAVATALTNE